MIAILLALSITAHATPVLDIAGDYKDEHGTRHLISDRRWVISGNGPASTFRVVRTNLENGYVVARNDGANPYFANRYSRFDYVKKKNGRVFFCQIVPDAVSIADAESRAPANIDARDGKGCAGFPFSVLLPKNPPHEDDEPVESVSGE